MFQYYSECCSVFYINTISETYLTKFEIVENLQIIWNIYSICRTWNNPERYGIIIIVIFSMLTFLCSFDILLM